MSVIDCVHSIEGSGPPLFMVHGIGSRRSGWDGVVASLKDDFTCISYDLRGHGDSPLPDSDFGLDDLVDDLAALQERLGIKKAHVIGHSLGGMIGPAYALRFPERVLTLGLLSTAAGRTFHQCHKTDRGRPRAERRSRVPLEVRRFGSTPRRWAEVAGRSPLERPRTGRPLLP